VLGFYLFTVHTVNDRAERSFPQPRPVDERQFYRGHKSSCSSSGLIMSGTMALMPTMLQNLMNDPALTTGLVMHARLGTMIAMFVVARLINPDRQPADPS